MTAVPTAPAGIDNRDSYYDSGTFCYLCYFGLFKASIGLIIGVAVLVVLLMVWSRRLKKQSILIERRFFQNLRSRDVRAEYLGEKKPEYAGRLLSHDLHLADMEIPGESSWAGKTLMELNLGKKFGVLLLLFFVERGGLIPRWFCPPVSDG